MMNLGKKLGLAAVFTTLALGSSGALAAPAHAPAPDAGENTNNNVITLPAGIDKMRCSHMDMRQAGNMYTATCLFNFNTSEDKPAGKLTFEKYSLEGETGTATFEDPSGKQQKIKLTIEEMYNFAEGSLAGARGNLNLGYEVAVPKHPKIRRQPKQ